MCPIIVHYWGQQVKVRRGSAAGHTPDKTLACCPQEFTRWWQKYKEYRASPKTRWHFPDAGDAGFLSVFHVLLAAVLQLSDSAPSHPRHPALDAGSSNGVTRSFCPASQCGVTSASSAGWRGCERWNKYGEKPWRTIRPHSQNCVYYTGKRHDLMPPCFLTGPEHQQDMWYRLILSSHLIIKMPLTSQWKAFAQ